MTDCFKKGGKMTQKFRKRAERVKKGFLPSGEERTYYNIKYALRISESVLL